MNRKACNYCIACILIFGLILRLLAAVIYNNRLDTYAYLNWAYGLQNDFYHAYEKVQGLDYPPIYLYVLYMAGRLINLVHGNGIWLVEMLILKFPVVLTDMLTAGLIYIIAGKRLGNRTSVILAALYAMNPAVFLNSAVWGQTDSVMILIMIFAFYAMEKEKPVLSTILVTVMCLVKLQGVFFIPVLLLEVFSRRKLKAILLSAASAIVTAGIVLAPFCLGKPPLWIINRIFIGGMGKYQYTSMHAYNLFSLLKADMVSDSIKLFSLINYRNLGIILCFILLCSITYFYAAGKRTSIWSMSLLLIYGIFMLSTRMHERYLIPAIPLCLLVYIFKKENRMLLIYGFLSVIIFINQAVVLAGARFQQYRDAWIGPFNILTVVMAAINMLVFVYTIKVLVGSLKSDAARRPQTLQGS